MLALFTFFIVLILSFLVVRVASVALTLTGLSSETARFQARSAWTGTGFTTTESEQIVQHPARRRIVTVLMVMRGAGLVTAASTLMLSFASAREEGDQMTRLILLLAGLLALWLVTKNRRVDRWLSKGINRALDRWTDLRVRDYAQLLHLAKDYAVTELLVQPDDWLANRSLSELDLPREGALVLGVQPKEGEYIGAPRGGTQLNAGDTVVLYGRLDLLKELDRRQADAEGEAAHRRSVRLRRRIDERRK